MRWNRAFVIAIAVVALSALGRSAAVRASGAEAIPEAYAALASLIGEWDVGPAGAAPSFIERFSWGPNRSYIWVSVALLAAGEEHLHLEGLVVWNAATRRHDYLFVVEPGSLTQERGEFHVDESGDIVREVQLIDASGKSGRFRQTFRAKGASRYETALMRGTATGWEPTFPGSDNLAMVRRGAGS